MADFGFVRRPCLHRGVQPLKAYGGLVGSVPEQWTKTENYIWKLSGKNNIFLNFIWSKDIRHGWVLWLLLKITMTDKQTTTTKWWSYEAACAADAQLTCSLKTYRNKSMIWPNTSLGRHWADIAQRCVLPVSFRWIYCCHSRKFTGKETGIKLTLGRHKVKVRTCSRSRCTNP